MREELADVVTFLRDQEFLFNADILPADTRRPLVDSKLLIQDRHFAVSMEMDATDVIAISDKLDSAADKADWIQAGLAKFCSPTFPNQRPAMSEGLSMISFFQKMAADSKSLIMLALGTCLFYFLVLIPLDKKVQALNTPLQLSWARLGDSINTNKLGGALDIHAMNELTSSMESTFCEFHRR